jgi:hypothetical protein
LAIVVTRGFTPLALLHKKMVSADRVICAAERLLKILADVEEIVERCSLVSII